MAYFNHAFCKSFLVTELPARGSALTQQLTAGQLGLYPGDWAANLDPDPSLIATPSPKNLVYLVQGSFINADKVGTHGGYKESVKTKGINPRYVTRLWSSSCQTATAATATIEVASDCAPCGENLFLRLDVKGSPALRFLNHNAYAIGDSSGSAALNNDLPGICCADDQEFLDPAVALAKAAAMLLEDPIITPFVQEQQWGGALAGITVTTTAGLDGLSTIAGGPAGTGFAVGDYVSLTDAATGTGAIAEVTAVTAGVINAGGLNILAAGTGYTAASALTLTALTGNGVTGAGFTVGSVSTSGTYSIEEILDGTYTPSTDPVADGVTASVTFVGAYVDTRFGDCTFDSRDFYEKEPVQIVVSLLDETGDPCNDCGVAESTPGVMQQTSGETVLRDLLLTERYMQNPYHQGSFDGFRMNEIEGFDTLKAAVDRDALYRVYYLQHSIPRLNNPTGVFDNDQYVYKFYVDCSDDTLITAMETLFEGLAVYCSDIYSNPITYETEIDLL